MPLNFQTLKKIMKLLSYTFSLAGILMAGTFLTSCDGGSTTDDAFDFSTARFSAANLANLGAVASVPLYIVNGDEFTFTPDAATTSHDESYAPVLSRHGATLRANGTNLIRFDRYQDPGEQALFPQLQGTWTAGENSVSGVLVSVDSTEQSELDLLTKFAAAQAESGGVFSNPFGDSNGDLDGEVSKALAQGGLVDVNIREGKGNTIVRELRSLGLEIYNNTDFDEHDHGLPITWIDPALRVIMRRQFTFTATSTNADIVNNDEISGTYQIEEIFLHAYAHNELSGSEGFIRLVLKGGAFAGREVIETGSFVLKLNQ